ncbi:PQQ-binding-like beta-propeller repeat protein [Oerskovia paurometabola]|uniref:PQQ-binding-like beta-propeller repeat protein n=1 Tax=Oerskovia paurometabola TaxID=162170 RepID=A0ABW1XA10_9CELL|nr:PQQ-binding-like beta-propeller repeat protein [Oerskovia paurometabola]MBM7497857.1 outer membrane protein assembly factor BamB [Oerskovia paurometabola]
MAPRRREHDAHAVELVEVAELDDDFDAEPSVATGPRRGSAGARTGGTAARDAGAGSSRVGVGPASDGAPDGSPEPRGRRSGVLGHVILGAVLLLCVLGASFAVGAVLERARAARVAAQAGGLWPVTVEPASVWRASTGAGLPAAVEGQVVVVGPGGTLSARDLTTGEEVWAADLPSGATTCGPDLLDPDVVGSPLVCVTVRGSPPVAGRGDDGFPLLVTVLDRSGRVVGSRGLADRIEAAVPLAGGQVATAVRATDGVVVTWEGALDGVVERVRTVGVDQDRVDGVGATGIDGAPSGTVPPDGLGLVAARGLLQVRSGGASTTFDAHGDPLTERAGMRTRGWLGQAGLPGGSSARVVDDRRTGWEDRVDVTGADGRVRFSMAGEPFLPQVADDGPPPVVVVRMPGFTGYDASTGRRLWHREEWPEVLWLQTDDVVVVESGSRLLALESRTGREIWQRWLPAEVVRVFTDGDSVLLATVGDGLGGTDGAATSVVSVSLFDGRTEWRRALDGDYYEVVSAQGVLFAVTRTEVVRLGRGSRRHRVGDLSHR